MLRLLIEDSEGKSQTAQISLESDITIGRKAGNTIRLKQRNVSREHARIFQNAEGLFVEPVHARYGMKVNGAKIEEATKIDLGDEIKIGDYRLYVQDDAQPVVTREQELAAAGPQPLPPDQQPRLVVISSNFAGREYPITSTHCVIGRDTARDICINQASVSLTHAEINKNAQGNFEIRDLGSSNGTKVNGVDVGQQPHELQSGEIIAFGHVVTRFCAPGELWYFNFGSSTETKHNTGLIVALCLAAVIVAVLATMLIMTNMNNQTAPSNKDANTAAQDAIERLENNAKLMTFVMECKEETGKGDFDKAQTACDQAAAINPNDTRLTFAQDNLRHEINSYKDYQTIENDIKDEHCREALNAIADIDPSTYAYKQLLQNNTKDNALECLENQLKDKALDAISNGDLTTAETLLSEIRSKGRANSQAASDVEDAINAKKAANRPARPSGSSGSSKKPASSGSSSGVGGASLDEICALAIRAKTQRDANKVCEYGKKAVKLGGESACKGFAGKYVKEYCK